MGVVVSETTMETRMAIERVTANSRNRRPTMPPMSRMGMNTAISEMLMEKTVKPISCAPWSAAVKGVMPVLEVAGDVFHDHDGVVHDEAGGDGEGHQREVVDAVTEQVHDGEGADERDGHGDAGDEGGAAVAQEDEDHQDDQDDGDDERALDVADRGADGGGAVERRWWS